MSLINDCELLTLDNADKWNRYLRSLPVEQQDVYFTPEYYRLYEELGDGVAKCFVYKRNNEIALYPFLINSVNDLGYELPNNYYDIQGAYGYNGVASSNQESDFIDQFNSAFESYCRDQNIIAEFTRFHPLINNSKFSENHLFTSFDRKTVYIDLNDKYEILYKTFQTTTRKQIRRAVDRHHIEVRVIENDASIIDEFLHIYFEAMNRLKADPYLFFTRNYFKSLLKEVNSVCFFAIYEKKPISAIIAIYDSYYMHGYLGGTLSDFLHLSPFSLLYAEMIKYGQKKSCRFLHVGGGATKKPDDPVFKYKTNFSDLTGNFFIGKKVYQKSVYEYIVEQWEKSHPEKIDSHSNVLLKYRSQ